MIIDPYRYATAGLDPYIAYVSALYHLDTGSAPSVGTAPSLTINAAAALSSVQFKWGSQSLSMTGAANSYAETNNVPEWDFSTGEYAVEFWFRSNALGQATVIPFDLRVGVGSQWAPTIYFTAADAIVFFANGADRITSTASAFAANTWYYVALARVSGTTRLYLNGNKVGSDFADANTYVEGKLTIGAAPNGGARFNGYVDEIRITKGHGRTYSGATITVPSAAFSNS